MNIRASDLEAYLDEALPSDQMARIEAELRQQPDVLRELAAINARRDAGIHSLGEIWRRHRLTCPTREQLGSYVLGTLAREPSEYIQFHLEVVGCRLCQANFVDLQNQQAETAEVTRSRRRKYFQSSAGLLRRD